MLTSFPADSASILSVAPAAVSTGCPVATDPADPAAATSPTGFADLLASFTPAPEAAPLPAAPVDTAPPASPQSPQPLPVLLWQFAEQLKAPVSPEPAAKPIECAPEPAEADDSETTELPLAKAKTPDIDPAWLFRPGNVVPPAPTPALTPTPAAAPEPDSPVSFSDASADSPLSFRAGAAPFAQATTPGQASVPFEPLSPVPTLSTPSAPAPGVKPESSGSPEAPACNPVSLGAAASVVPPPVATARLSAPSLAPVATPAPSVAVTPTPTAPTPGILEFTARDPAAITLPADVSELPSALTSIPPAQISAPVSTGSAGERDTAPSENKKQFQSNDNKKDALVSSAGGTVRAYEQSAMSSTTATFAAPAAVERPAEVMTPAPAAAAVRMIERVAEAAGQLSARPSEPVSLSIQLDDTRRVDISLSLRDGRVHTAFRSDSPEVRAALSAAWQDFVRSPDRAGQKWAEPVFTALGSAPSAPGLLAAAPVSDARLESGLSGQGQDPQSRRNAPGPQGEPFFGRGSRAAGSAISPIPVSKPSVSRADSSRHLSVVA